MQQEDIRRQFARFAKRTQKQIDKSDAALKIPLPKGIIPMHSIVKEGKSGDAEIQHYEVRDYEAMRHNINSALVGQPQMSIHPGKYTRLLINGEMMMSDATHEAQSNRDIIENARGHVLIGGLGIGMVLAAILPKRNVKSVTVIEKSEGVMKLVRPQLLAWREHQGCIGAKPAPLFVFKGDIDTWEWPGEKKFDTIYLDIWPTLSTANLPQIAKLKKKFKKYLKPGGWLGVWVEDLLKRRSRFEKSCKMKAADLTKFINGGGKAQRATRKAIVFSAMYSMGSEKVQQLVAEEIKAKRISKPTRKEMALLNIGHRFVQGAL